MEELFWGCAGIGLSIVMRRWRCRRWRSVHVVNATVDPSAGHRGQAIQVCACYGYVRDLPVEKWYRDAKLYTIFEGTSEIQRMVIGRTLAAAAPPLHHRIPTDGPALGRTFGRGTKGRSVVVGKAIRVASNTPPSLMRLPMKMLAPPHKDGR